MMKNARNVALGGCLAALGMVSVASVAFGQIIITPPNNCFCGPVNNCAGVPIRAEARCDFEAGEFCFCQTVVSPECCVLAIAALCVVEDPEA